MRHRTRHHHLRRALVMEVAISEAHAGDRAAEADFGRLVEIETGLEWQATQRRTDRLATDLQRVAGQADMADRTGAGELHRAHRPHVVEDAAGAAGTIEAVE